MGEFNDLPPFNDKSSDYFYKKDKFIIKYNKKKENCFNLLIGYIDKNGNNIYIPEILINFKEKDSLNKEFDSIIFDYDNFIKKYYKESNIKNTIEYSSLLDNNYNKDNNIKFIIYGYSNLNTQFNSNKDYKNNVSGKNNNINIIKFFIKLFYEYKEINNLINNNSIKNGNYYLINKNFIDIYKNYYSYSNIEDILENNNNINNIVNKYNKDINYIFSNDNLFNSLLECFPKKLKDKINNLDNKNLIYNLSHISLYSINYDYCKEAIRENNEYLKIYKDFELWTKETLILFQKILFININNKKEVNCFLGENNLLLLIVNNKNYQINICKLDNNYSYQTITIIMSKNLNNIIEKINKGNFLQMIFKLNNNNNKLFSKIENTDDIVYFLRNNKNLEKIIDILLFNEELLKRSQEKTTNIESKYNKKKK